MGHVAVVMGEAVVPAVVNTRLVATVQARAGMRCHQSANLLSTYYLCADVYLRRTGNGEVSAAAEAWRTLKQTEQRLREFLTGLLEGAGREGATDAWSMSAWPDSRDAGAGRAAMAN